MTVSWRNTLLAAGSALTLSLAGYAVAQSSGHVVSVPGVTVGTSTHTTSSTCCDAGKSHTITAPGVTIPNPTTVIGTGTTQVGSQYIYEHSYGSTLSTGVVYGADTRTTFISNRSYIPMADPIEPSALDLNVKGSTTVKEVVTEKVPVQETVCVDQIVEKVMIAPVQAVCLDDTGMPHPASRLDGDLNVDGAFSGEVFRCVSGTFMQVTIGSVVEGKADFSKAQTFRCSKGEALVHKPGGELACAAQAPRRNCNERSLLRKYGAGLKLIETKVRMNVCEPTVKTRYEIVQKEVEKQVPLPALPITLDGGVGQIVTY